ncbi:MAG: nucleotide sugar dehydrogenase [Alphaproteobacteria bacterium]
MSKSPRIAVIGLGYVGLPLAVALARKFATTGFDINEKRVAELKTGIDRTGEVDKPDLAASRLALSFRTDDIRGHDVYIVTVPTPVDERNRPDLGAVRAACRTVGTVMGKGAIVVFESTVYPGVTEDICGPELEVASGLKAGSDFFLGYSPERINPGDREHTVNRITKVVAGQTPEVTKTLADVYGAVTTGGVFIARNIKTAEAAKVIENAQRDINIAFINEVTMIFERLGVSIYDVLAASATKWNFLNFSPGLVGGHCIGVDPFYLAHVAQEHGHHPEIILAGRRINDGMGPYAARKIAERLKELRPGYTGRPSGTALRVLVLGLTFKENVPDLRNSKVIDLVTTLTERNCKVDVHDALADPHEAKEEYRIDLLADLDSARGYDCVLGAVPHAAYARLGADAFQRMVAPGGLIADLKGMWRNQPVPQGLHVWRL